MAPALPIEFTGQRESRKSFSAKGVTKMKGKSRKVSKGYSSGFVPEYRHAVDTMADSQGLGSSGRVDTNVTASEDSGAPSRKRLCLNADYENYFGVPVQVFSVSKISLSERKELERRLRSDLEQVRILQKKIDSLSSIVVAPSQFRDIHTISNGLNMPVAQSKLTASQGSKKNPVGRNGPRTKGMGPKRGEPVKQMHQLSTTNAMLMKQCETLLNRLMSHKHGWIFNEPVDIVKANIPDYFDVIKHPMDFGTVKSKLLSGEYQNPLHFAVDVRLTFSNAMTYNPPGNDVHFMADVLSKFFEVRWKPIEKKLLITEDAPVQAPSMLSVIQEPPAKKQKLPAFDSKVKQEPPKQVVTEAERRKLGSELESLLAELPETIIDFLREISANASQTIDDEIEIDIEALSDGTLMRLRKLLDDYIEEKRKRLEKDEPHEIELQNESGFSNSSVLPFKGSDVVEEDVDIVGNDPPISSFPPVEIEKDDAHKNSRCSSSSSSSSESGSSSSDSDSDSSSASGSDGAKASVPISSVKETCPVANLEKEGHSSDPDAKNIPLNGASQVEENDKSMPVSVENDGRQEGESAAPPERQVSPEKLYRAALLRTRFADTILKAQEKALETGENNDPEKLRLEKEELERRLREEKARLQAEAKAAEEARRKAEAEAAAEAAAEAKRKIVEEREAARLALQQMEKTVVIHENSQFMEDLEMLRASAEEQLHSLVEETSPDESQNGGVLGSFKFEGSSNPLEQLGLYMKADEEEEEDEEHKRVEDNEHKRVSKTVNDTAEEGEID